MWVRLIVLGYEVSIKVYEVGSKFGMQGLERVSKMEIVKNGKMLAQFDRGDLFINMPHWIFDSIVKVLAKAYGLAAVVVHHAL